MASGARVSAGTLLGYTDCRLFLQRVLQTADAGIPCRARCSFTGIHSATLCGRRVGGSRRLADRTFRSTPRHYDWDGNFRSDLGCESALQWQPYAALCLLRSPGVVDPWSRPNTLWHSRVALVRPKSGLGTGPDDARNRLRSRGHANRGADTNRTIRVEHSLFNSWRIGFAHLLANRRLLSERETRRPRSRLRRCNCDHFLAS